MLQTWPVLISRRHLVLGAAVTAFAGCSSRHELGQPVNNPADSVDPVDASAVLTQPNPEVADVPKSVVLVGDSISAQSREALQAVISDMGFNDVRIDAEPSRRIKMGKRNPTNGLDIVSFIHGAEPPGMWVIALGTNDAGLYTEDDEYQGLIDDMLGIIGDDLPLVWVNAYRDDHLDGCVQFNELLRSTLERRGRRLVSAMSGPVG